MDLSVIFALIILSCVFIYAPWLLILVIVGVVIFIVCKLTNNNRDNSNISLKQDVNPNNSCPTVVNTNDTIIKNQSERFITPTPKSKEGIVSVSEVCFNDETIEILMNRYIAFDVETTGLNARSDRIIEIGAVIFENGCPTKEFTSLVNSVVEVPYSATAINMITTDMVRAAPSELIVYDKLVNFLGDALNGTTIICAHNASFDMSFLSLALKRLGYYAKIYYVDTLSISRSMIYDIENYKQPTIANYFSIESEPKHRASSDAKVCGVILSKLLSIKLEEREKMRQEQEKRDRDEHIKREAFIAFQNECQQKRESVSINPINERVPLNEIHNLNDTKKGYDEGYTFFCNGESYRKANDYKSALKEYDMARYNGYCNPAIYHSYAMVFRKLKDYDNEISILDEAIQMYQNDMRICERFEIRRDKVITLFIERQEKAQIKANKQRELKERQLTQAPKNKLCRAVFQLSDDMTIIKEFNSVSEAAKSIGISEKVIRETAKGRQRHAGGFIWKYVDEYNNVFDNSTNESNTLQLLPKGGDDEQYEP